MTTVKAAVTATVVPLLIVGALQVLRADFPAHDPGVRSGTDPTLGGPIAGLTTPQANFFEQGKEEFDEAEDATEGLGPRFNLDSCVGCHAQPVSGGTSPFVNPQVEAATKRNGKNSVPSFISLYGPVREARFKKNSDGTPDGGVHSLFVTSGRDDALDCDAPQEDFEAQLAINNVIFRIPTPVFGAGLIEMIPEAAIDANRTADAAAKATFGISGHANRNGNDGTIARFGWKAQNKSLLLFAGEAYNVEMGISNEIFLHERDESPKCQYAPVPNAVTHTDAAEPVPCLAPQSSSRSSCGSWPRRCRRRPRRAATLQSRLDVRRSARSAVRTAIHRR